VSNCRWILQSLLKQRALFLQKEESRALFLNARKEERAHAVNEMAILRLPK
jgi:hypothetical protein